MDSLTFWYITYQIIATRFSIYKNENSSLSKGPKQRKKRQRNPQIFSNLRSPTLSVNRHQSQYTENQSSTYTTTQVSHKQLLSPPITTHMMRNTRDKIRYNNHELNILPKFKQISTPTPETKTRTRVPKPFVKSQRILQKSRNVYNRFAINAQSNKHPISMSKNIYKSLLKNSHKLICNGNPWKKLSNYPRPRTLQNPNVSFL